MGELISALCLIVFIVATVKGLNGLFADRRRRKGGAHHAKV
jgi:hypothetical protein